MKFFDFYNLFKIIVNEDNLKLILLCIIFIISKKLEPYYLYIHPFYLPHKKTILSIDKSKKQILKSGRKYLDKCLKFKKYLKFKYIKQPQASVIVPLFNCEKTIASSLNSIQFQNITKIEIILINDFSTDNTSEIIKKFKEKDHRIIIIENHKNMGALYSRSIASLISKGYYIFNLDNDDLFFDKDVLDYIYKRANNEYLDIVGFLTVNLWNYTAEIKRMKNIYTIQYPEELYLEQPELGIWMIKFKGKFLVHNNMIWDKCIKSSIYKKAVDLLGIQRYSNYLSWAEDTCINYMIFNLAQNFKYVYKYGVLHFKSNFTSSLTQSIDTKLFGEIFFLDLIYDFSRNNTDDKNFIVGQAFYIYNRYNIRKFNNTSNCYYLKFVLNKIMNCSYLCKLNRRKIKKVFYSFFSD